MASTHVQVSHVTRVEGHGNIVVEVRGGELKTCRFDVVETPRFFEAMLRGRSFMEASHITSRICGICAVGHATTSLLATERALGVEVTPQTRKLRQLNCLGEILDSHILHAYLLVAPDLLGAPSVLPLARSAPEVVTRALRMKKLAGDLCAAICGRHTHPIAMTVGGFLHTPTVPVLETLLERFEAARKDVEETVALFASLTWPRFERDTEYVALRSVGSYGYFGERIASSLGDELPPERYRELTNERVVSHSSAKHAHHARDSYMVGALARYLINHGALGEAASQAAAALGLEPRCRNPFFNTVAQLVELVQAHEDARALLKELITSGVPPEPPVAVAREEGLGVGVLEVPRGLLIHAYEIREGRIHRADCVIPTSQNLANLEGDMRGLVTAVLPEGEEALRLRLEMLVRAYDPCISCATHLVDLSVET